MPRIRLILVFTVLFINCISTLNSEDKRSILYLYVKSNNYSYDIGPEPSPELTIECYPGNKTTVAKDSVWALDANVDLSRYLCLAKWETTFYKLSSGKCLFDTMLMALPYIIDPFPKKSPGNNTIIIKSITKNGLLQLEWNAHDYSIPPDSFFVFTTVYYDTVKSFVVQPAQILYITQEVIIDTLFNKGYLYVK